MISSLKVCVLAIAVASCSALQIATPSNVISQRPTTIEWTNEVGDPGTWSFYLVNEVFNNNFGLSNNVDPASSKLTVTLPVVPARDGYTWIAVELGNINNVYARSGTFSISEFVSSTASSTSSSAASSSASSGSGSVTSTSSSASTSTTPRSTSSNTFATITRSSSQVSSTGTSSSSAASGTTTPFNAAGKTATIGGGMFGAVVLVVSALAGGVFAL